MGWKVGELASGDPASVLFYVSFLFFPMDFSRSLPVEHIQSTCMCLHCPLSRSKAKNLSFRHTEGNRILPQVTRSPVTSFLQKIWNPYGLAFTQSWLHGTKDINQHLPHGIMSTDMFIEQFMELSGLLLPLWQNGSLGTCLHAAAFLPVPLEPPPELVGARFLSVVYLCIPHLRSHQSNETFLSTPPVPSQEGHLCHPQKETWWGAAL